MRFYTIEAEGKYLPVVSADGGKTGYALSDLGFKDKDIAEFVRNNAEEKVKKISEVIKTADSSKALDMQLAKICAPIMHPDQDIICLGINYKDHAAESAKFDKDAFSDKIDYTIYFGKHVAYASASGDPIPLYEGLVEGLDYESELAVVIGTTCKAVSKEEAMSKVFGYTVINDVSARNLQTRHKQWLLGKGLDGFTPMGPCIVTPDELGDPEDLEISSLVNGEIRQHSNTGLMIQTIPGAISELSAGMTLKAGTIIATGTPSGVGMGFTPPKFLNKGDRVICRIEGIGEIENYVE